MLTAVTSNAEQAFADAPEAYAAWRRLVAAVKGRMGPRRYELVTLAAALRLRSSYCSLAHGVILAELGEDVLAVVRDRGAAGLDELDLAIMGLAEQIVDDATAVTDADRARLRDLGLSDAEILDVVLAVTARCFFSKTLDAVGALADPAFRELDPELREALTVGRPIAEP